MVKLQSGRPPRGLILSCVAFGAAGSIVSAITTGENQYHEEKSLTGGRCRTDCSSLGMSERSPLTHLIPTPSVPIEPVTVSPIRVDSWHPNHHRSKVSASE
jgi:hypothetical protein